MRIGLILAAVLALGGTAVGSPLALGQSVPSVGIDVDITGNDDSNVGVIDNCAEIPRVGDTLTMDLVVQGIDPAVRIRGYQVDIDYDDSVIKVIKVIGADGTPTDELTGGLAAGTTSMISRIDSLGGAHFLNLSEAVPDSDGSYTAAAIDGTLNPTPPDNYEDGEGVLARITVEAVGTGVSDLIIAGPKGGADGIRDLIIMGGKGELQGKAIPIGDVLNAAVSVAATCTPPPPSTGAEVTGTPSDSAMETPQAGTPVAGTPETGTPGAGTPVNGGPDSGVGAQTPGPGTPVSGGSPVSGDEGGAGGEAPGGGDSDGGLSAGAWAGIGVGIAAAVLAASGAGWFALRRRRAGGASTSGGESGSE